jgi:prephenate dehydratase
LDDSIQDQIGNTTRFFIIVPDISHIYFARKANKVSILFEAKNIPSSLYKCLGAFATNGVNLSKIESIPSFG